MSLPSPQIVPIDEVDVIEEFVITVAGPEHFRFAPQLCELIESAAKARGTGIAKREPEYVRRKMLLEVATVGPGFLIDEAVSCLGQELKLPPWEEPNRSRIE